MNENKPPNEDGFFAGIRKSNLIRSRQRWIGGVSSAVADRTRLDLTLVRGLFIITALFGVGFLAYGAAWLLLPEEGTGTILAEDASRGRIEGPLIAAGIFLIIGFWAPFNIGNWAFGSWLLIPNGIGIAITVIVLLVVFSKNSAAGHPPQQHSQQPPAYQATTSRSQAQQATEPIGEETVVDAEYAAPPQGPGSGWEAPAAPEPKEHRRAGTALVSAFVGLALIAAAIAALADIGKPQWWVTPAGAAIVVLGLGVVLAGFMGRSSSALSPLALVTLFLTVSASVGWIGSGQLVGNISWKPTTSAQVSGGKGTAVGSISADLRDVPRDFTDEVDLRFAVGDISVIVPDDRRVVIDTALSIGDVSVEGAQDPGRSGVFIGGHTYVLGEEFPEEDELYVSIKGVVGDISVTAAQPNMSEVTS